MPIGMSDKILLKGCMEHDNVAWSAFLERYIKIIYNAVRNTLVNAHSFTNNDIEDICQDIFIKLISDDCRVLSRYNPDKAKFSTWITIVSRNAAIDYIRKKKDKTVSLEQGMEVLQGKYYLDPEKIDIPHGVLTPRQHLVLRMMYDDSLDVESVAQYLCVERQTVRSLHHRALKKLREFYGLDKGRVRSNAVKAVMK